MRRCSLKPFWSGVRVRNEQCPISCLHGTKRVRGAGSCTGATPGPAPCNSLVYERIVTRSRFHPEIPWKGDVGRRYVSALNSAALPALRPPPPSQRMMMLCVAVRLLSTQLKADSNERQRATMFELGTVAPAQTVRGPQRTVAVKKTGRGIISNVIGLQIGRLQNQRERIDGAGNGSCLHDPSRLSSSFNLNIQNERRAGDPGKRRHGALLHFTQVCLFLTSCVRPCDAQRRAHKGCFLFCGESYWILLWLKERCRGRACMQVKDLSRFKWGKLRGISLLRQLFQYLVAVIKRHRIIISKPDPRMQPNNDDCFFLRVWQRNKSALCWSSSHSCNIQTKRCTAHITSDIWSLQLPSSCAVLSQKISLRCLLWKSSGGTEKGKKEKQPCSAIDTRHLFFCVCCMMQCLSPGSDF